jgi:hypothetical protein
MPGFCRDAIKPIFAMWRRIPPVDPARAGETIKEAIKQASEYRSALSRRFTGYSLSICASLTVSVQV